LPRPAAPAAAEIPQLGLFATAAAPAVTIAPAAATVESEFGPPDALSNASDAAADEVVAALRAVDPDDLSPRAALDLVAELRKKLTLPPNT
jgi:hypothetical protein